MSGSSWSSQSNFKLRSHQRKMTHQTEFITVLIISTRRPSKIGGNEKKKEHKRVVTPQRYYMSFFPHPPPSRLHLISSNNSNGTKYSLLRGCFLLICDSLRSELFPNRQFHNHFEIRLNWDGWTGHPPSKASKSGIWSALRNCNEVWLPHFGL